MITVVTTLALLACTDSGGPTSTYISAQVDGSFGATVYLLSDPTKATKSIAQGQFSSKASKVFILE